jgi:hypothetical protein
MLPDGRVLLQLLNRDHSAQPETVAGAVTDTVETRDVLEIHDVIGIPDASAPPDQEVGAAGDDAGLVAMPLEHGQGLSQGMGFQVIETGHADFLLECFSPVGVQYRAVRLIPPPGWMGNYRLALEKGSRNWAWKWSS